MNLFLSTGRVFLGISLTGIGVLHFFYPGIRPIILPDATHINSQWYWIVYVIGILLTGSGILICINKKVIIVSLIIGFTFLFLFLFGHLPLYLSAITRADKLKYWVNLNKTLALSGGFFILASISIKQNALNKSVVFIRTLLITGRYFFAIMLLLFGTGHLLSTASLSALVPSYIPFAKFWTFVGGIILAGSAISIFINFKLQQICFVLAVTLFIWLITLHLYYTVFFSSWQEGENFIGTLTCLAFCGTALLLSQNPKINFVKTKKSFD